MWRYIYPELRNAVSNHIPACMAKIGKPQKVPFPKNNISTVAAYTK